jgi:hypothetical protein
LWKEKFGEMIGRSDILFHETLLFYFFILGNSSEKEDKKMGSQLRERETDWILLCVSK